MESKYMSLRKSRDDEEFFSDLSMDTRLDLQRLRKTKLLTQILFLLATLAFIANVYLLLRNSRAVNLQDGLLTELVPPSKCKREKKSTMNVADKCRQCHLRQLRSEMNPCTLLPLLRSLIAHGMTCCLSVKPRCLLL